MTTFSLISVLVLCSVLTACSGSQFKAGSTHSEEAAASLETKTPEETGVAADQSPTINTESSASPESPALPTATPLANGDDRIALDECIKNWSMTPFSAEEIAQPRLIEISEVVNNNALIYSDSKITAKPTLFLVNFNINVGNNGELAFLNPKGWYCFNVKAKIINNFLINTACDTHVAIVSKLAQNDKNFTIAKPVTCPAAG